MRIFETAIPDIHKENIDKAKLNFSNKIINKVSPLFDKIYISKSAKIKELKNTLKQKKSQVAKDKELLENILSSYNKQKAAKKLLLKITTLVNSKLIYDSKIKNEIIILLKIIDNLGIEKLKQQEERLTALMTKRFK